MMKKNYQINWIAEDGQFISRGEIQTDEPKHALIDALLALYMTAPNIFPLPDGRMMDHVQTGRYHFREMYFINAGDQVVTIYEKS